MMDSLHCPRCGKKLTERVEGSFLIQCSRCKTQVCGETKPLHEVVVTAVTANPGVPQRRREIHT